jgi:hypothetical protein
VISRKKRAVKKVISTVVSMIGPFEKSGFQPRCPKENTEKNNATLRRVAQRISGQKAGRFTVVQEQERPRKQEGAAMQAAQ